MPSSLIISGGGGGGSSSGGNASVGLNGGVGPTSSTQIGDIVAGVFTAFSPSNPIPISGTITALNASVGPTGVAAPVFATEIGVINAGGNLVGASATNPVRIDPTGTTIQPVSGTITALQGTSPWVVSGTVTVTPSGLQNVNLADLNAVALGSPSAYGTSPGAVNVIGVNAFVTNLPATQTIAGNKTNNNAAPGATNLGALVAIANAAAPTWTEGDQVLLSVDLSGVQRENVAEWGGTAVTAPPATGVPATGLEVSPVVKTLTRKFLAVSTTTPLGAGATFTSAWFDTDQTGGVYVEMNSLSNVTSGAVAIQQSDDQVNVSNMFSVAAITASTPAQMSGSVTRRYWRIVYTNGATLQTTFALNVTEQSIPGIFTGISTGNGQAALQLGGGSFIGGVLCAPLLASITTSGGIQNQGANNILTINNNGGALGLLGVVNYAVTDGTTGGQTAALRTPNVFKTVSVPATASGNTALWTPTAGKKFRLMRYCIFATNLGATAATVITILFQDSVTGITVGTYDILLPAAATSTAVLVGGNVQVSHWVDLGNGYLSVAANNVLNVNVSATVAGATGSFRYNVCGTEE